MNIVQILSTFPPKRRVSRTWRKPAGVIPRWGDTPRCPYYQSTNAARTPKRHRCYTCKTSFSVTSADLPPHPYALAEMVSGHLAEPERQEGIICPILTGIGEMDETDSGGRPRQGKKDNKPQPGRGTKKAPVIGAIDRGRGA